MNRPELTAKQREWLGHVERCAATGQPMSAYAKAHGLNVQAFYSARAQLIKRGALGGTLAAAVFTEVRLTDTRPAAPIRIRFPNGCVLEADAMETGALRALIAALLGAG